MATQLTWKMDSLGVSGVESATLAFRVRHRGVTGGVKKVNQSIQYSDAQGNLVDFPDPTVNVKRDLVVCAEPCPTPVDVVAEGCSDTVVVDVGDVQLGAQGRIIQLEVTVKDVCPNRRVALGVMLEEVGPDGKTEPRGFKAYTIPAHTQPGCRDVQVQCIRFVVPEDVSLGASLCVTPAASRSSSLPRRWIGSFTVRKPIAMPGGEIPHLAKIFQKLLV